MLNRQVDSSCRRRNVFGGAVVMPLVAALLFMTTLSLFAAEPAGAGSALPQRQPVGKNCNLTQPPAASGEYGAYGVFGKVYPRRSSIDQRYSGCQVFFATEGDGPLERVWIVEVVRGETVRIWSDHPRSTLNCHYRAGKLLGGSVGYCPQPELMPSVPAGCMSRRRVDEKLCEEFD